MKVLVRSVVIVVLAALVGFGLSLLSDSDGGADIGAGLLAFLVVVVVSFVWALRDAVHLAALFRVLVRWLVVAVLVGLVLAAFPQIGSSDGFSVQTYLDDLRQSGLLGVALVLVPAAVGALLGRPFARRRSRRVDPPPPAE